MDILQKRFAKAQLTHFELLLTELNDFDINLLGEVKEIEKKSFIIKHKFFLVPKIKNIDFSKIEKGAVKKLMALLDKILSFEVPITQFANTMGILDIDRSRYKQEDRRLLEYFKAYISSLFKSMNEVRELINFLFDAIKEHDEKELEDFFSDLANELNSIKKFCHELKHYSEFWKKRVNIMPYIDTTQISKSVEYYKFIKDNPDMRRRIIETENKIETFPDYNRNLHEILKNVDVVGYPGVKHPFRAKVHQNMRIIYLWDQANKRLRYLKIGSHQMQDRIKKIDCSF